MLDIPCFCQAPASLSVGPFDEEGDVDAAAAVSPLGGDENDENDGHEDDGPSEIELDLDQLDQDEVMDDSEFDDGTLDYVLPEHDPLPPDSQPLFPEQELDWIDFENPEPELSQVVDHAGDDHALHDGVGDLALGDGLDAAPLKDLKDASSATRPVARPLTAGVVNPKSLPWNPEDDDDDDDLQVINENIRPTSAGESSASSSSGISKSDRIKQLQELLSRMEAVQSYMDG